MTTDRIRKTEDFMKAELSKVASFPDHIQREAEYRIEHSYRVARIGETIAEEEGFDVERTVVACLLHDVGYSVGFSGREDYRNHGRYGARIARPFLLSLGFTGEETNEMCYGIAIHVDDLADFDGERTPLALTVGDADNVDRFDAFRLYEGLHVQNYRDLPIGGQRELVEKTLSRLSKLREAPCGTKTAERLWKEKIDYQTGFYRKLMDQIENSSSFR